MLLYDPPFLMVNDMVVYRDSADAETFYWLKGVPGLVRHADEPAFWASVFLPPTDTGDDPEAVTRTTVSCDIELTLSADQITRLEDEIQRRWGRRARRLSPVPLSSGRTSLVLGTTAPTGESTDLFVHTGHPPALVAGNRAAFAVAAEGREARILAGSLLAGHLAAVVSYHLEYPGIAPAFQARMQVDWSAVYSKLRDVHRENFIFVSEEIDSTIESLKQTQAVQVEILELDPDGAGAATQALFDQLREQVMQRLFESPLQIGQVPVEERISAGVRDILSSLIPGRHHLLRRREQIAQESTTIDLREQRVRTYGFHAQSTLAGLAAGFPNLRERIGFVNLGMLPQRLEEIRVELAAGSEGYGVRFAEVEVEVTSPDSEETVLQTTKILRPNEPEPILLHYRRPGEQEPETRYRVKIHLDPERSPSGREVLMCDWRPLIGDRIWLHPEEWLDIATLRVLVDDASLFRLPARLNVEVETLSQPTTGPPRKTNLELSAEQTEARHTVVVDEGGEVRFRVREVFQPQGDPDFIRDIGELPPGDHRVMNPFGQSWQMRVMAAADWSATQILFAEFRVWDVERELFLRDEYSFSQSSPEFILAFSTSSETPPRAEVRLTRLTHTGQLLKGPWKDIVGPLTVVRDDIEAVRRLRAMLLAPHFAELNLRKVWAEFKYADPANGIDLEHDMEFDRDGAVRDWLHPFPDPTREQYRFRLRALSQDGDRFNAPWTETALDHLRLELPEDPFS